MDGNVLVAWSGGILPGLCDLSRIWRWMVCLRQPGGLQPLRPKSCSGHAIVRSYADMISPVDGRCTMSCHPPWHPVHSQLSHPYMNIDMGKQYSNPAAERCAKTGIVVQAAHYISDPSFTNEHWSVSCTKVSNRISRPVCLTVWQDSRMILRHSARPLGVLKVCSGNDWSRIWVCKSAGT